MAQYELNLFDYWLIIRKHRYTILLTAGLVVGFTLALTQFLKPTPIYQASTRVQFDRARTVGNMLLDTLSYSRYEQLPSQAEVIRSFPVLEAVAKQLQMLQMDATPEMRSTADYLHTIYSLQGQIETTIEMDTNIIKIMASAENPDLAERLANAVAVAYRAENIKSQNRKVVESRRFVEDQLAALARQLKEAENRLLKFKEGAGQVFLDEEAKAALATFTKLEEELNRLLRLKDEATKQIAALKRPGAEDKSLEGRIFTDDPAALLSVLNSRLVAMQQERADVLISYTTEHPKVQELDRKIAHAKAEMVGELQSKLRSLINREMALREQISLYESRYLRFPKAAVELARLERDVKVTSDLQASLKVKHQELLIQGAHQIEEVTIIEPAVRPVRPVNAPNSKLNLMVGSLMGVFLGIVLAFMRESFDTSIGTIEGVEEFIKVPVLGVIPQFSDQELKDAAAKELPPDIPSDSLDVLSKLVCVFDPKSVLSEGFRSLRTNMQFASMDRKAKTILFTSAGLGEGKTTTVVNLAITLAQDGKRVLVVDADLRKPVIHARLGVAREPGLTEVLVGGTPWREAVRSVTDLMIGKLGVDRVLNTPGLDNLNVLTSGTIPPNPAEYLNLPKVTDILAEMREEHDIVLVDTPPILPIADAVLFSAKVDGAILVYQVGRIGRDALKRAKFLLDHAQAKVLGVVLTNVRSEITPEYGYYRYEYR